MGFNSGFKGLIKEEKQYLHSPVTCI